MTKQENDHAGKPQRIQSIPAPPDTKSWYDYIYKTRQETPKRLEECAKLLIAVITITLTLLLTLGKSALENGDLQGHFGKIAGLWLISLLFCLFVVFPWPYRYSDVSLQSFKNAHRRIICFKYNLLIIAVILLLIGLGIFVWGS
ncbi:MAG: hypothetical protein KJ645_12700 [Planctomycetes bacterium]|nr:hypothetical protein [Planctomycetota bacterium]